MAEYIEREAAIAYAISGFVQTFPTKENGENWIRQKEVRENLKAVPAADVAPVRHGHWIAKEDYNMDVYYECSACGETWTTIDGDPWDNGMSYCPHCGARMDG